MSTVFERLVAPFDPSDIGWRVGPVTGKEGSNPKGMALAFVDARAVMRRLDEATAGMWQCDYIPMPNHTMCCRIGVKVGDEWLWRSNGAINYPDGDDPKADAKEMAAKGSYSDAFKRAAVLWGIGQYLYDMDSPWVAIKQQGKSWVIADEGKRALETMLRKGSSVSAAIPQHEPEVPAKPKITAKQFVDESIATLDAFNTQKGIDAWLTRNDAKLKALMDKDAHEAHRLERWVSARLDTMHPLAAG